MLLLVDEVKKRTQFLNTYIDNLSQSINKRRYNQALSFINQQRPAVNHTNVTKYNPNTFIIDSLKTKNQNLTQIKKQLEKQKALLQKKLDEQNKESSGIKSKVHDSHIMTVISKIQITLKDIKRVEYQPMLIESDYEKITIINAQDKKTIYYLTNIFQVQKKSSYMLLHYKQLKENQQNNLWAMIKFSDQNQMLKWYNLIYYGKMVQQAKGKRYLFLGGENYKFGPKEHGQVERKTSLNDQSQVVPYSGQIPTQGNGFRGTFVPQKPSNFQKQANHTYSFNRQNDPSLTLDTNIQLLNNPLYPLQKHMTHSLLLTPNDNNMMTKKVMNNYSTFRPTPLNRIRGKSMYLQIEKGRNNQQYRRQHFYNNYQEEKGDFFDNRSQRQQKLSHKNNFRKASQDITLRLKNQSNSQQRKLQKFRSQRNLLDDLLAQSAHVRQPKKPQSIDRNHHSTLLGNNSMANGSISGNSRRIQKQIEKKNEFLERVNNMNFLNSNSNGSVYNSNILSSSNKKSQNQQQSNNNRRQLQTTARWFNEEDLKSQSVNSKRSSKKSQFSHNNLNNFPKKILYNKENKQLFEQQIQYSLEDQSVQNHQLNNNVNNSKKITNNFFQNKNHRQEDEIIEASQSNQISPTFPKKIVYEDGSHIRLYPVEFTNNTNGHHNDNDYYNQPSQNTIKNHANKKNSNKQNIENNDQDEQKDNVFIQPLDEMQQNQIEQSRHGILRNDRLNTLDSQTDKDEHNHTNEMNQSNSQDHQEQEFQQLIDQLKKGLILTKCSQGSFWTRQKEIKLSQNQNTLLIIDVKDKKIKKLPISDIQTVEYGKFSKGIIKHIPQIEEKKCLIINVRQGKLVKKIQFVGNNPQKLALFTQNLAYFVEMFKAS